MYNLKERKNIQRTLLAKPIQAAKRRRQLYPFFFHMGPVALCITSALLIALMAIFYLSQLGQAVATNQQLQDTRAQQSTLQRQNQDLVNTVAQERSPTYIAGKARQQGLVPADPKNVHTLMVPHLQPISDNEQRAQP